MTILFEGLRDEGPEAWGKRVRQHHSSVYVGPGCRDLLGWLEGGGGFLGVKVQLYYCEGRGCQK